MIKDRVIKAVNSDETVYREPKCWQSHHITSHRIGLLPTAKNFLGGLYISSASKILPSPQWCSVEEQGYLSLFKSSDIVLDVPGSKRAFTLLQGDRIQRGISTTKVFSFRNGFVPYYIGEGSTFFAKWSKIKATFRRLFFWW